MNKTLLLSLCCTATVFGATGEISFKPAHNASGDLPLVTRHFPKLIDTTLPYDALQGGCYRGNLKRNGVLHTAGPESEPTQKVWSIELGEKQRSSPVVFNSVLYIGSRTGMHAFDATTGEEKWTVSIQGGVEASACIENDILYIGGNDGILRALRIADGSEVWTFGRGEEVKGNRKIVNSAAVAFNAVFIGLGENSLFAVDKETGTLIWTFDTDNVSHIDFLGARGMSDRCSPTISPDGMLYTNFGSRWGRTAKIDIATSLSQASFFQHNDAGYFDCVALSESNVIQCVSSRGLYFYDSAQKGNSIDPFWTEKVVVNVGTNDFRQNSAPSTWKNYTWAGTDNHNLYCVAPDEKGTNGIAWTYNAKSAINSAACITSEDSRILFGTNAGMLISLDAFTGTEQWTYDYGTSIRTMPWVDAGMVYIATDNGTLSCMK